MLEMLGLPEFEVNYGFSFSLNSFAYPGLRMPAFLYQPTLEYAKWSFMIIVQIDE